MCIVHCPVKYIYEIKIDQSSFNPLPPSFHLLPLVSPRHHQNSLFLTIPLLSLFPFFISFSPNPILLTLSFLSPITLSLSVSLPVPVPVLPPLSFTPCTPLPPPSLPPCPSPPSLSPLLHSLPFPFLVINIPPVSPLVTLSPSLVLSSPHLESPFAPPHPHPL